MTRQRGADDQYCAIKRSHADRAGNGDPRRRSGETRALRPDHPWFLTSGGHVDRSGELSFAICQGAESWAAQLEFYLSRSQAS
jgi:hypothetical protein